MNIPDFKGSRIIVCDTLVPLISKSRKGMPFNTISDAINGVITTKRFYHLDKLEME